MNAFDVLREKFKQKKKISIDFSNGYRDSDKRLSIGYANKALAMGEAIEIVNQVEQEFTPKTNADRIRAMSDEELAEFIANDCLEIADEICGSCTQETTEKCGSGCCVKHIVSWLQKEG